MGTDNVPPPTFSPDEISRSDAGDLDCQASTAQLQTALQRAKANRESRSVVPPAPPQLSSASQGRPLFPSDLISTRTRRRRAAAAGSPKPAVKYGFDSPAPASPPAQKSPAVMRPPSRSSVPSPPIERPDSTPCLAPAVTTQAATVATKPAPPLLSATSSDVDPPSPLPGTSSPVESVELYSHADWAREYRAEPDCDSVIRYLLLGSPQALPDDSILHLPSHKRPPLSDIRYSAGTGRLHRDDDWTLLLVRNPTPARTAGPGAPSGCATRQLNDEPTRRYVPQLVRPWISATPTPPATLESLARSCARARLLVDRHEPEHTVVVSTLPPVPSTYSVQTDNALARPVTPVSLRP